ncbi:hypothetical protein Q0M83_14990, partial [Staphylococcus aureus]|nr:hypothetical protein [Staphylococcus aureus]
IKGVAAIRCFSEDELDVVEAFGVNESVPERALSDVNRAIGIRRKHHIEFAVQGAVPERAADEVGSSARPDFD